MSRPLTHQELKDWANKTWSEIMNQQDIISMAREAGWTGPEDNLAYVAILERFAALVAAAEREQGQKWFDAVTAQHKQEILAEREACAKFADQYMRDCEGKSFGVGNAIRARGENK